MAHPEHEENDDDQAHGREADVAHGGLWIGGRLSRLDERDGEAFLEILNYLSTYESDKAALQRLLNEARQVNPRHAVVDHLERLL